MKNRTVQTTPLLRPLLSMLITLIPAAIVAFWAYSAKASTEEAFANIDTISAATDVDNDYVAPAQISSTPVKPIQIEGLSEYAGENLTVFYVSGRKTSPQTITVRTILTSPVKVHISASGRATIPAIRVPKQGFDALSAVVFVVHSQPDVFLRNPNGVPSDPRASAEALPISAFDSEKQWVLLVNELDMTLPEIPVNFH